MNPIVQLIIAEVPSIVALIKERRQKDDPNAPPLTGDQILRGFEEAFADSFAKDEMLKAVLKAEIEREG